VHARHAEAGHDTAADERGPARPAEPDDEQADTDDDNGDQHAEQRQSDVVADFDAADTEPQHGDEVHHPDAGATDGHSGEQQPQGTGSPGGATRPGRALQAQQRPGAGHRVRECRSQKAEREMINFGHPR